MPLSYMVHRQLSKFYPSYLTSLFLRFHYFDKLFRKFKDLMHFVKSSVHLKSQTSSLQNSYLHSWSLNLLEIQFNDWYAHILFLNLTIQMLDSKETTVCYYHNRFLHYFNNLLNLFNWLFVSIRLVWWSHSEVLIK